MSQNLNNKTQRKNANTSKQIACKTVSDNKQKTIYENIQILCIGSPTLSALQKSERQDFCRKILARLQNLITEKEMTKGELRI